MIWSFLRDFVFNPMKKRQTLTSVWLSWTSNGQRQNHAQKNNARAIFAARNIVKFWSSILFLTLQRPRRSLACVWLSWTFHITIELKNLTIEIPDFLLKLILFEWKMAVSMFVIRNTQKSLTFVIMRKLLNLESVFKIADYFSIALFADHTLHFYHLSLAHPSIALRKPATSSPIQVTVLSFIWLNSSERSAGDSFDQAK